MNVFGHNLKNVGIVVRFNDGNDSRITWDFELGNTLANKINVANETNDFPPPAAPPYNKDSYFPENTASMNSNCFGCGSNLIMDQWGQNLFGVVCDRTISFRRVLKYRWTNVHSSRCWVVNSFNPSVMMSWWTWVIFRWIHFSARSTDPVSSIND